jgi:hypothetical protein
MTHVVATMARVMSSRTRSMATVSIATTVRDLADNTWIWLAAHDRSWRLPAIAVDLEGGGGESRGSPSASNLSCSGKPYPSRRLVLDSATSLPFLLQPFVFVVVKKYVRSIVYDYM